MVDPLEPIRKKLRLPDVPRNWQDWRALEAAEWERFLAVETGLFCTKEVFDEKKQALLRVLMSFS